jgi:hypothetical protein
MTETYSVQSRLELSTNVEPVLKQLIEQFETFDKLIKASQEGLEEFAKEAEMGVSFGFHALEALGQAAAPDLALTKVLRLRGNAVSLSREGHKAQRKLDRLQRDRRAEVAAEQAEPATKATPARPQVEEALDVMEFARHVMESASGHGQNWTKSFQQREAAKRIAAKLKKNQAAHEAARTPAAVET